MPARPRVAVTLTQCWHRVPGGTASSILRLTHALQASGRVDVVGVAPRGDLRSPASMAGAPPLPPWTPTVPLATMPLPLPTLYDAWARWGRPSIEAATGPVDLVHLTVPMRAPRGRAPVVATVHDVFPLTDPDRLTDRGARLMRSGLEWIRANARMVAVPSDTVRDECVAHGFRPDRLRVVPWGAQVRVPEPHVVTRVLERHRIGSPYVLFVGTLEPRKNLATLLRAMARLDRPDLTLVIVGPQGWGDALGDDVSAVASPVAQLGFVDDADLAALQRGAAAFCLPSLAEGFGLPVLEAMAAGAAVVTSRGTATEEVAGDAALLVDPLDVDGLAEAIRTLVDPTPQRGPDVDRGANPFTSDSTSSGAVLVTAGEAGEPEDALVTVGDVLRERAVRRAADFTWERAADLTIQTYLEALA